MWQENWTLKLISMKRLFKYNLSILFAFISMGVLVSCSDTYDIGEFTAQPEEPYQITIGFGLNLETSANNLQAKSQTLEHNYKRTGYNVIIEGDLQDNNLVDGVLYLENVDLNDPIFLKVTGPIEVIVEHPEFNRNDISPIAYFGIEEDIDTYKGSGLISVPLNLVQGFIAVTASDLMSNFIDEVEINNDDVNLNQMYYYGKEREVNVEVRGLNRELAGAHDNVLGEGMIYEVTIYDVIGKSAKSSEDIDFNDFELISKRVSY